MKKLILAVALFTLISMAFAEVTSSLTFSTDEGKTWSPDFPTVTLATPRCRVKVTYVVNEPNDIQGNIITTMLYCKNADFASANRGRQFNWAPRGAYFQRPPQYYANPRNGKPFIYQLDLGARKDGLMGIDNRWDKSLNRFVPAPLGACTAWLPGTYTLYTMVSYRSQGKLHQDIQEFKLIIK